MSFDLLLSLLQNGSFEDALCRRLMMPFTPGKFKRHLLKDMSAKDGEAWRQVWEHRRHQLAQCCGQVVTWILFAL